MTPEEIGNLIKKHPLDMIIIPDTEPWMSQYDPFSQQINYAFVIEEKPKTIVEFGTRGGGCTFTILRALLKNGGEFVYKPYELEDDLRAKSQKNIDEVYGDKSVKIGGDITKATDIPNNIDYLFVDNYHDYNTTKWVFETLLPNKVKDGALVHFHDLVIHGDFKFSVPGEKPEDGEMLYFHELYHSGKFPLEKIFWSWEHNLVNCSSTWWRYKKI